MNLDRSVLGVGNLVETEMMMKLKWIMRDRTIIDNYYALACIPLSQHAIEYKVDLLLRDQAYLFKDGL